MSPLEIVKHVWQRVGISEPVGYKPGSAALYHYQFVNGFLLVGILHHGTVLEFRMSRAV